MLNCALLSLRCFESIGMIMGMLAFYTTTNILTYDMHWQDTVRSIVFRKEEVNVVDFITKTVNWEYPSCLMQAGILIICIGHIVFCQNQLSPIKQFTTFKTVSKCSAYISAAAGICLVMSATYSDDKKYKHIMESVINAKVLSSGIKLNIDPTFDFLCSNTTNVWSNLTTANNASHEITFATRLSCQYSYKKYMAVGVLLFNVILFGTMYNYANTKKSELQRADLTRFIMERVPLPASGRNINRIIPMAGSATISLVADDLPPPYDAVVVNNGNKTSNEVVDASPELINGLDGNNNFIDHAQSESLTDIIVNVIPPPYIFACSENKT